MRSAKKHTLLIAGASGVVGQAATDYFAAQPDFQVMALSRRPFALPEGVVHVPLDLNDAQACAAAADNLSHVTHVLYAALFELPDLVAGWRDVQQMQTNEAMLRNLLDALQAKAKGLRHITIMQGTKAYGGHVEPAPVPCKESSPRHDHANFYWLQEDMLRQRQPHAAWTFSILRPQIVFGYAVSSPMNIVAALGAYAAVQRELGQPLHFPGGGRYINAASDSRLIAQAAHFVATHEVAANETYNVVNGDLLVWQDIWGSIAQRFGMVAGAHQPLSLTQAMPAHEDVWQRVVSRHGLQNLSLQAMVGSSWQFTDRALGFGLARAADSVLSPLKLHQHGFHGCMDTEESFHYWLERMQHSRLLPR
jgi:nucleoside-diphosphate-sugar epimerase